ncbi:Protein kinase, catalytic domain-containing protein [Cynara cardunculus var. scolymus]|uniref:Protein kinase, catalytic domain-containing protein n=1 Tax=Cynara cardunculus var. scolymus TaxID=59895 RepID=A0A124SG76_CYNCS|nr:Protein kinase, catalytic domain-containing protein [Cynara cardunculus var. scolymus]
MSYLREVEHLKIPLPHILLATDNFDEKNFIATGGFGKVYQGQSDQYGTIAVKRLYHGSGQGQHEFMMEISLLSAYKHENLASLVGFCDQDDEKILVYKHESNGSLDKVLQSKDLNWIQRLRICLDAAHGLKYLHDDVGQHHRVLHRDIKSSNILLDENWKAKISDFGLSKIGPANVPVTFLISNACGTIGYIDPEYLTYGVLTQKSDVYSFGVVLFEVLCGRLARAVEFEDKRHFLCILAQNHYENGTLDEIIDSDLRKQMNPASLSTFSTIAYQCLKKCREDRPTMSQIGSSELCDDASRGVCHDDAVHEGLSTSLRDQGPSVFVINDLKPRLKQLYTLKGHLESVIELKGLDIENIDQSYSL